MPQRVAADRLVPVKIVAKSSHIRQQSELLKQTHLPMDGFSMSRLEVLTPCGFTVRAEHSIEPTRLGVLLGAIVAVAHKPPQPIEKGLPAPGLCAHMVLSKFGDDQLSYDNNAAVRYSLARRAKANGVEPFAWLRDVFSKLPYYRGGQAFQQSQAAQPVISDELDELLLDRWLENNPASVRTLLSMVLTLGIRCSLGFTIDSFFCPHSPVNISLGYQHAKSLRMSCYQHFSKDARCSSP